MRVPAPGAGSGPLAAGRWLLGSGPPGTAAGRCLGAGGGGCRWDAGRTVSTWGAGGWQDVAGAGSGLGVRAFGGAEPRHRGPSAVPIQRPSHQGPWPGLGWGWDGAPHLRGTQNQGSTHPGTLGCGANPPAGRLWDPAPSPSAKLCPTGCQRRGSGGGTGKGGTEAATPSNKIDPDAGSAFLGLRIPPRRHLPSGRRPQEPPARALRPPRHSACVTK